MKTTTSRCTFDDCCELHPPKGVSNLKYCPDCRCKRKAENARKAVGIEELFEQPRQFKVHKISKAPEGTKIIVVNDAQIPFTDWKTMEAVEKFWDDFQPDLEVYDGDMADFYTISQFDKNPSRRFTFRKECDITKNWVFSRAEANPSAERVWIDGNHEDRLRRFLWRYGAELNSLKELTVPYLLGIDEVKATYLPYMSVLDFLGFRIEHGWKASTGGTAYPINVSRFMATKTGSSGLCGHTHRFSHYSWSDARGSHSYVENGCLCLLELEFAPFPNWQQAFTYGVVHRNQLHVSPVQIYPAGFRAEGEFYPRRK